MARGATLMGGIGIGAAFMYFMDPARGRRRRAWLREKSVSVVNEANCGLHAVSVDAGKRAQGVIAQARSQLRQEKVPDNVLVERVRAKLGRYCSHPHAVKVSAREGRVVLSGPILENEEHKLLPALAQVKGVRALVNRLSAHKQSGNHPALQGGAPKSGPTNAFRQANWSPTARAAGSLAGAVLALAAFQRKGLFSAPLGAAGAMLLARGMTNLEMQRLLGLGVGRRAVDIQKTIQIKAPVDRVFSFWANYQNFPRFMRHVREVKANGQGHSHWRVAGPGGVPIEWDAVITKLEPGRVLAWKSTPNSFVAHAGVIHFETFGEDCTRVDIKLSYNPPAGAIGHVVASLFGADPKSDMDEDLLKVKTLLESGGGEGEQPIMRLSRTPRPDYIH